MDEIKEHIEADERLMEIFRTLNEKGCYAEFVLAAPQAPPTNIEPKVDSNGEVKDGTFTKDDVKLFSKLKIKF